MANRIVLAGGTGYLGTALAAELARHGATVVVAARGVSRPASPASGTAAASGPAGVPAPPPRFHSVDLTRPASLENLLQSGDTVVHLVARSPVRRPRGGRRTYRMIHVEGTRNLLAAAEAAGARRFVYLSALGVTRNAGAAYAETKAQAERLVDASSLESTIVLPSILFSSDSEIIKLLHMVSRLPAVPLPEIAAPFRPIHVTDAARRIGEAVLSEDPPQRLPLTGPEELSFSDFVRRYLLERGTFVLPMPPALTPLLLRLVSLLKIPDFPAELDRMLAIDNAGEAPARPGEMVRYSRWVRHNR